MKMVQIIEGGYENEVMETINGEMKWLDYLEMVCAEINAVPGRKAEIRLSKKQKVTKPTDGEGKRYELWVDNIAQREEKEKRLTVAKINAAENRHNNPGGTGSP